MLTKLGMTYEIMRSALLRVNCANEKRALEDEVLTLVNDNKSIDYACLESGIEEELTS